MSQPADAPTRRRRTTAVLAIAIAPLIAAGDTGEPDDASIPEIVASQPLPDERCEANRDAGTITYLSGFEFAAAASMVEVFVAEASGYYDELCLDVEVQPSFSTSNYTLVAGGDAHFASGGSFTEVLDFAASNEADLVAVIVDGRFPIDGLIVKPGVAESLGDLAGATIGVKGKLPPSIAAMLLTEGLVEGDDYETVLLDGFDPLAHIDLDGIDGFPGWKSNEPGQLDRAGVAFDLFDPADFDVPGSFGVIYTSRRFLDDHPSAAQDFVRATLRGLADALDDPDAAVGIAAGFDDPALYDLDAELFRWQTDAELLAGSYPEGAAFGVPDVEVLQAEVDTYGEIGIFAEDPPPVIDAVEVELTESVYDEDLTVIWPG